MGILLEFHFKKKELIELYTKGKSRKYKLTQQVVRKFMLRIAAIENANTIYDLRTPPSMNFESLEGFENRFSIRIDQKYRLEFEIEFEDEEKTCGEVLILEVSKHYEWGKNGCI